MKKLLLLPMLFAFALMANAQSTNYHAFKFDIQLGYADPSAAAGMAARRQGLLLPFTRITVSATILHWG